LRNLKRGIGRWGEKGMRNRGTRRRREKDIRASGDQEMKI
jgi:hypothetical protein